MIDSEIPRSLFCLRGSRTNRTLVRATGEDHSFADNFSEAEIILLAKDGQAKIAVGNFFGAVFAPIFSRPLLWAEKAVNFLNREGQKRGATHSPRQSVLVLYIAQQCQNYKNVTLCQRVTETLLDPRKIFLFSTDYISTIVGVE